MTDKRITPKSIAEWRTWLENNHLKETKIYMIKYKKHTGKPSITNIEAMREAICFGWIDTTIKRLDDERYQQCFVKRNKNSKWSDNTIRYGKELIDEGKMSSFGLKMYKEGLSKKTHDYGIPKNPEMPDELKKELEKNKEAKEKYNKLAPSIKNTHYRAILKAKLPETKQKRVYEIIASIKKEKSYSTKFLGKKVKVTIDRKLGSKHPKWNLFYPINYGYIEKTKAPDGEEVDAYVLGITKPINSFSGICIAIIHRLNDNDDKLVVVPENMNFSDEQIHELTNFQEQYFKSEIIR